MTDRQLTDAIAHAAGAQVVLVTEEASNRYVVSVLRGGGDEVVLASGPTPRAAREAALVVAQRPAA